jgi:hypothetical protein
VMQVTVAGVVEDPCRSLFVATCMHAIKVAAGIRPIVYRTLRARPLLPPDCLISLGSWRNRSQSAPRIPAAEYLK